MARTRSKPEAAKQAILEVALRHLQEGGPDAVKVQRIARDLGLTDAAVHYHFKNRRNLLAALLRHAGADLKRRLAEHDGVDVDDLVEPLHEAYAAKGAARLAMWLALAGWEDEGSGMFAEVVDRRASHHQQKEREEVQYEVAFLNLVLAAEPLMGGGFLRSVGLDDDAEQRRRFHDWMVAKLDDALAE